MLLPRELVQPNSAARTSKIKPGSAPPMPEAISSYTCISCSFTSTTRKEVDKHRKAVHGNEQLITPLSPRRAQRRLVALERRVACKKAALTNNAILWRERGSTMSDGGKILSTCVGRMKVK